MPGGRFGLVMTDSLPPSGSPAAASTVENWNLTDTKTGDSYVASNTYGGTQRGGGVRSWSGSFSGRGDKPPIMPNDEFTFIGYTAPDTGVEGTAGTRYEGPAICSSISMTWNWQANQIFSWTADFQGNPGLDIQQSEDPVLDTSIPPVKSACQNQILYATDDTKPSIIIPAMVSATLTITAALASESNSSTFSGTDCYTKSTPGPIDWTLAIPQEDYQRGLSGYPDLGQILRLDLFVDGTNFWDLRFGRVEDYSNLTIDRNTGATIARTLNIAMCAADSADVGLIVLPGGVDTAPWWGKPKTP